eukprot:scaffold10764_cov159-Ochromonas_danica.AAC.2
MVFTLFPWWVISTGIWLAAVLVRDEEEGGQEGSKRHVTSQVLYLLYLLIATFPPILLSWGILTRRIKSRVQLGSQSNRNGAELLFLYSLIYAIYLLFATVIFSSMAIDLTFVILTFLFNQIFPWMNHRTLLADTKFWRGLGRHNQGGLEVDEVLRKSGADIHRPTMELHFVTSSLQNAMSQVRSLAIDFAFLQLQELIGQGATAKVYRGRYRNRLVAVKLSTPPEVDEEVINTFIAEANLSSSLKHRHVVDFVGICVRPPQIGMVFEFCEGGNLKQSLHRQALAWTPLRRLRACHDAATAITFMHSKHHIHRDIKTDNFFVGRNFVVKLGDFGESTAFRRVEDTENHRMTILGTVAYMAPELIAAERYYTEAIDIYALAITFWEIWTGKDPYEGKSTFDIYEDVNQGRRPPLPDNCPDGFPQLLHSCWAGRAEERAKGPEIVEALDGIINRYKANHPECYEEEERHTGVEEEESSNHGGILDTLTRISINLRGRSHRSVTSVMLGNNPVLPPIIETSSNVEEEGEDEDLEEGRTGRGGGEGVVQEMKDSVSSSDAAVASTIEEVNEDVGEQSPCPSGEQSATVEPASVTSPMHGLPDV